MENIIYPENLTKKEVYDLTRNPAIKKMKAAVGQQIKIKSLYMREEVNADGEIKEVCSIMDTDGNTYATNSRTFISSMQQIINIGFPAVIEVIEGTSRNDRTYIDVVCDEFMEG